ncbi:hypothetical protein C8Q74DRAFT_1338695 [Fomes fomentarius]|nr:hypothetical protein C8Q74DRAFT_1338695 [Fomes fomentarius]
MSCSLCRLPFTPSDQSYTHCFPPKNVLSEKQILYMNNAVGMGYIIGLAMNMECSNGNNFLIRNWKGSFKVLFYRKMLLAFHPHCATILRYRLGYAFDDHDSVISLSLIDRILSPTIDGVHAGRLRGIQYESLLGDLEQRVDIESLWYMKAGDSPEDARFHWEEWLRRGLDWTAARADIFPRFRTRVAPSRLSSLGPLPESTNDCITTQSLDILHVLLPYFDNKSFVNFLGTCRTLRYHALTTFQSHARRRVLALPWAIPTEVDYDNFVKRNPPKLEARPSNSDPLPASLTDEGGETGDSEPQPESDFTHIPMAHPTHSPHTADWQLYLSHVHRTATMRARRWVWALAGEVAAVYHERRAAGPYADKLDADGKVVRSKEWLQYEMMVRNAEQGMVAV